VRPILTTSQGAGWDQAPGLAVAVPPAGARSRGPPHGERCPACPATPVQAAEPEPATPEAVGGLATNGIPTVALSAYRVAAARLGSAKPGCGIDWSLLAGIGRVESNHTATGQWRTRRRGGLVGGRLPRQSSQAVGIRESGT
jgi:hypothetical protein